AKTAGGADVILHALNPPYTDWSRLALPLAYSALTAAETTGATLLFPANLYNYGSPLPPVIHQGTPPGPSSRKGQLRVAIQDRISEAAERHACHHSARRRQRAWVVVRSRGRQRGLPWLRHLSRVARRVARMGLSARFCVRAPASCRHP